MIPEIFWFRSVILNKTILVGSHSTMVIKAGDKVPNVDIHYGFPPESVNVLDYTKGKMIVLLGLPGAFTTVSFQGFVPLYTLRDVYHS
jgi:hypothetical protein